MPESNSNEKREFVRSRIAATLRLKRLADSHGSMHGGLDDEDVVASHLVRIEEKLDKILEILEPGNKENKVEILDAINLSGGGVKLHVRGKVEAGDEFVLSITSPELPSGVLETKAVVVRAEPGNAEDEFCVAMNFLDIMDADQEKLIKYSFAEHRKAIRNLKD